MAYHFERIVPSDDHIDKLFQLLSERKHVISHTSLPSFENHSIFVKNHPYLHWFLVWKGPDCFGSFYIKKDNSIGLNLIYIDREALRACVDYVVENFTPQAEQHSVVPSFFYINVAYSNNNLLCFLEELGLTPIQISLKLQDRQYGNISDRTDI